jgi:hypothetical protein
MSAVPESKSVIRAPREARHIPCHGENASELMLNSLCDCLTFLTFKLNRNTACHHQMNFVFARVKNEALPFNVLKMHFIYWTPVNAATQRSKFRDFCLEMF